MKEGKRLLKKFGFEREYLDWKTNLPVSPEQLKVGTKFVVTKGGYEGRKGIITSVNLYDYETDMIGDDGTKIVVTNSVLDHIKLIL